MNRLGSYLKNVRLARMMANEAHLRIIKGDHKAGLIHLLGAFNALLTATNNFTHLQFHPRKKSPLARKKIPKVTTAHDMPDARLIITSERTL